MSNDTKFWIARIAVALCAAFALTALLQAGTAALASNSHSLKLWAMAFCALIVLGTAAAFVYYRLKPQRWDDTYNQDEANKIAVETLAKLGEKGRK